VKLPKKDPIILTLDGHCSHLRNIQVIDHAWEMLIVCLPVNSTPKLQPLGVSSMQPLKTILCTGDRNLAEEPPKRVVAHYQITGLVGKAYLKLATAAIAADGFQKTCLFPCNCNIFDKHDPGRISVIVCLKNLFHVPELQKNCLPLAVQIH
jgi:hypothetical protein